MAEDQEAGDIIADLVSLGGAGLVVTDLGMDFEAPAFAPGVVQVGVCRSGPLPAEGLEDFDILLCADPSASRPWAGFTPASLEAELGALEAAVHRRPVAAAVAAQVLRASLAVSFEQALAAESLAYSMLLSSGEFRAWRAATPVRAGRRRNDGRVGMSLAGPVIQILLSSPSARNAFDARMRDSLCDVLDFARGHPDGLPVVLSGGGPCFSAGGDLDEFGTADDPGVAHLIRTLRSPAHLAHMLGERLTVQLHGACVGAGIEVPAAAARVVAREGAWFRLPEVAMGLIPGAGGTASIPRRIGRHRTAYMAISGADIDLPTALAWGLVDAVTP